MTITSPAFAHSNSIPAQYTCSGANLSPALSWSNIPAETKSLVLIMHDPDAPAGDWLHWLVINIPVTTQQVAENTSPLGGVVLTPYDGPCPPNGEHRYMFDLYALDVATITAQDRSNVEQAIIGHILAQGTLMGVYKR